MTEGTDFNGDTVADVIVTNTYDANDNLLTASFDNDGDNMIDLIVTNTYDINGNLATQSTDFDADGTADEVITNIYGSCILPVELLSFKGMTTESGIQLLWETASEKDNKGFSTERSSNTKKWKQISFVAGNGTTLVNQRYTFIDESPIEGINYYRLEQIDLPDSQAGIDETYEYSKVVSLKYASKKKHDELSVFPNPTTAILNYQVSNMGEVQTIQLFDIFGKLVKTVVEIDGQIALDGLAKGTYLLVFKTDERCLQQLVVKW